MKKTILFFSLLTFISCAKVEETSNFSVDFTQFLSSNIDLASTTIVLTGKSQSGKSFTRVLNSASFSSDIPRDIWDFHIITWSSAGSNQVFRGHSFCASSVGNNLIQGDASIDLVLSVSDCSSTYLNYIPNTDIGSFSLTDIKPVINIGASPSCPVTGDAPIIGPNQESFCKQSVSFKYFIKDSNNGSALSGGRSSECLGSGLSLVQLNIPHTKVFEISGFEIYNGSSCSGGVNKRVLFDIDKLVIENNNPTTPVSTLYLVL